MIKLKKILTIVLGLAAYAYIFYIIIIKQSLLRILFETTANEPIYLILALLSGFLMVLLQGYYLSKVFKLNGVKITLMKSTLIWLSTIPLGIVTFGLSGFGIIYYQAKKQSNSDKKAFAATVVYYAANLLINTLVSVVIAFSLIKEYSLYIVLLLFILVISFFLARKLLYHRFAKYFDVLVKSSKSLVKLSPFVLSTILANILIFIFTAMAFRVDLSVWRLIQIAVSGSILSIYSPTGSGVGVVEAGIVGIMHSFGISLDKAAIFSLVYRVFNLWLPALFGYAVILNSGIKRFRGNA